ncbi:MAG TPA: hypothetical protein VN767_17110 [Streptosporangiaceae bacterium]|nr:hypothetical protein [Streptosporangiaceae bacterium]
MFRRILFLLLVPFAIIALVGTTTAASASTTTFNPANAPQGTHVQTGSPGCTVSGLNVSCRSFELAGVGNTNAQANLSATYSATVVCINGGGNPSDSQHQGTFTSSTSTGQLSPKNGRLTVPSLSVTAPTEQQFLAQQTCPNPNWTPTIPGGIKLSSFTYTVSFVGFGGPYITVTGP